VTNTEARPNPASSLDLFVTFTWLALQGFGGVLAVSQRVLCEDKRWLTKEQFVEILALAQILPGPNVCNIALTVGDRFHGWRGAFAALAGMLAVPLLVVLALAALYVEFAGNRFVAGALRGMGAVAAGLIVGTGLKLAPALRKNPMGATACALFGAVTFVLVALLRLPMVWVLLGLGAIAVSFAWFRIREGQSGEALAGDDGP